MFVIDDHLRATLEPSMLFDAQATLASVGVLESVGGEASASIGPSSRRLTVLLRYRKQSVSTSGKTITAREAAQRLDVSTQRLRQLILTGDIHAQRHGHVWAVDPTSVDDYRRRRRPTAGRSLSPRIAWAALLSDFGTSISDDIAQAFALHPTEQTRIAKLGLRDAGNWRWLARRRATTERFQTFGAYLGRIARHDGAVRTGVSALADYNIDLLVLGHLDVYLPEAVTADFKKSMRLQSTSTGNLTLRSGADQQATTYIMQRTLMPRSVVAVDLLDDSDTRTACAGADLIEAILDGR